MNRWKEHAMLQPGDRVGQDGSIEVIEHLHRGMTANAYRCSDRSDGSEVFLKEYTSPRPTAEWYTAFVRHQRKLSSLLGGCDAAQFCLLPRKTFETQWRTDRTEARRRMPKTLFQSFAYIADGQNLEQRLASRPAWSERLVFARVFLAGLCELHKAGVVHGDLKPANIQLVAERRLATGFRLKLIDLDFAHIVGKAAPWQGHSGHVGTPGYWSPEHVLGQTPGTASDVYTAAVMLVEMLAGDRPFAELARDEVPGWTDSARPSEPKLQGSVGCADADARVRSLLVDALAQDSSRRPSAMELHQALLGRIPAPRVVPLPPDAAPVARARPPARAPERACRAAVARADGCSGAVLSLVAESGRLEMRTETTVGRIILNRLGAESRYAAERQFVVCPDRTGWILRPLGGTPNATWVNGRPVRGKVRLDAGDVVSLGPWIGAAGRERLPARVEIRMEVRR
jgi:hypothetical protein